MSFFLAVPIVLVGNKTDLIMDLSKTLQLAESNKLLVTTEEGYAMAEKIGAYSYLECSAQLKEGVREVFVTAAQAFFEKQV